MVIINAPTGPFPGIINIAASVTGTGLPSNPLQLLGDVSLPGISMLYGTNALGVRGWYAQPTGGSGSVGTLTPVDSISGGGPMSSNIELSLVNDNPAPGSSMLYGTGPTGILGWYSQPVTTVGILNCIDSVTGGGSMTSNVTIALVGDVPVPANDTFYGIHSGARGYYQVQYSTLGGLPTIPTVGALTTIDSLAGGGAMTGSLTINLVGDVVTPTNGQFYGYAASARGWVTPPTVTSGAAGYAPASGGGTVNFLCANGTWVAPAGSGGTPYLTTFTAVGGGSFAIPGAGTAVNVTVGVNTDIVVGQQHNLTDGTHFIFATVGAVTGTTITYVNNGGGGSVSGTMSPGHIYMGSGPEPSQVATNFLSGANTFITPPTATATTAGYVSPPNNVAQVYRGDATWQNFSSFAYPWAGLTGVPNNTISAAGIVATAPNDPNQVWTGTATWGFAGPGTSTTANFTIPVIGLTQPISIKSAAWPVVGQTVWINDGTHTGFFEITVVASSTAITIINRGFLGNTAAGQTVLSGAEVQMACPGQMTATQPGFAPAGTNSSTQVLLGTGAFGTLAYSSLSGLPSIPTVGTLTTTNSLTGGGAMTGNLTVTLVGDVTTPTTGQFYGYTTGGGRAWSVPTYAGLTGTPSVPPNTTTTSAFTMVAVGTQMTVAINAATWPIVGQLVEINDGAGGHFGVFEITTVTSSTSIGVTNRGFLGTPVTGSMGIGAAVILSSYGLFGSGNAGCVSASGGGSATFLCANGTWATPSGTGGPFLTTSAGFTAPAANATVTFAVGAASDMVVGQKHIITDGTSYMLGQVTVISGTNITYKNNGGGGAVSPTVLASGHIYMASGTSPDFVTTHWLRGDNTYTVIPYASVTGTPSVEPNTTTTSSFAIPALGGAVTVFITSAAWPIVGQTVEINDGTGTNFGFFEITSVTSSTQIQVTNRGYLGNPVTGTMGSGATVILTSPGLMTSTQPGFAPSGTGVAGQFLNGTGAFSVLPSNTVAQAGIVSTAPNDLNKVYRGDASWAFVGPTTELNGSFAVPVIGGSIALTIAAATWPVVGQTVWISDGTHVGFFQITTVTDSTHITVKNMGYLGNSISGSWANASLVQLAGPSIATATQPGDLPAPPNNTYQFLNGQAVFVTPVLTYAGFVPYDNIPYSTTYPAFNVRGSYGLPVLDCVKLVETDCLFSAVMPQNANLGSGLTIIVKWTAHVATIGNVVWQAQYARLNGSIATASFSGAATQTTTTSGTIDSIATTSIAIASTTITAGDLYLIMVSRLGANVSDTMADTAELLSVEVRSSGT